MAMLRRARRLAIAGLGLISLAACATASSPDQMTVAAEGAPRPAVGGLADHSFKVGPVNGGAQTQVIGLSDVSNEALQASLSSSLRNLGYLADDPGKAAYVVSADLMGLDRPAAALDPAMLFVPVDMNVTAKIHYVVTSTKGGRPVFDEVVATTGTGHGEGALTPGGRVRKGNEDAIRLNIVAFLQRLQTDWK